MVTISLICSKKEMFITMIGISEFRNGRIIVGNTTGKLIAKFELNKLFTFVKVVFRDVFPFKANKKNVMQLKYFSFV